MAEDHIPPFQPADPVANPDPNVVPFAGLGFSLFKFGPFPKLPNGFLLWDLSARMWSEIAIEGAYRGRHFGGGEIGDCVPTIVIGKCDSNSALRRLSSMYPSEKVNLYSAVMIEGWIIAIMRGGGVSMYPRLLPTLCEIGK